MTDPSPAALVRRYDTLESTMLEARRLGLAGAPAGTTIVARTQSAGRGRRGRTWFSPPDAGLWMTQLLRPQRPRTEWASLSVVVGVAVQEAVARLGAPGVRLKWPNDLLAGDKKLAGLLLEAEAPFVLVGIGLNLVPAARLQLPADLADRYVGLEELVGHPLPVDTTLDAVLAALATQVARWEATGPAAALAAFAGLDALFGTTVRVETASGRRDGIARGLDAEGALLVDTPDGRVTIRTGEVERLR